MCNFWSTQFCSRAATSLNETAAPLELQLSGVDRNCKKAIKGPCFRCKKHALSESSIGPLKASFGGLLRTSQAANVGMEARCKWKLVLLMDRV